MFFTSLVCYLRFALLFGFISSAVISCHNDQPTKIKEEVISQQLFRDSLPKPIGYVNDYENIFSKSEIQSLDSLIRSFEKKTTIQIAIVTLSNTMATIDSFDNLTLRLAKYWGVGQKEKDNGVLIGFSASLSRIRIQNGYEIEEILSDHETSQIIETTFIPSYKKANYFEGTYNGLRVIMALLEKRYKTIQPAS